jgi:PP-loop superfamily ATP-utilizing enzyme
MTVAQCCKRLALTIADSADAATLHDYAAELHKITREMVKRVEEAVK